MFLFYNTDIQCIRVNTEPTHATRVLAVKTHSRQFDHFKYELGF